MSPWHNQLFQHGFKRRAPHQGECSTCVYEKRGIEIHYYQTKSFENGNQMPEAHELTQYIGERALYKEWAIYSPEEMDKAIARAERVNDFVTAEQTAS